MKAMRACGYAYIGETGRLLYVCMKEQALGKVKKTLRLESEQKAQSTDRNVKLQYAALWEHSV
ncbi:hypothetical protein KIN20_004042 [Parelaphostrongylus tenuis]|uniref:Uncharacterized protein n=1 Tax=Parelaphostrongylus tenuis TaxID=148309 RepID=A0AAD5MQS9_PARTN|nr:hypothetical protein KIN20_004042 [Parelaphostrongylus tenuis]